MIDKNSPIPVYYQLKEDIKEKIDNKIWEVGQCIHSERELAENYGVSRMTVRQALGELVNEGILVREKGKGTFVCEPKVKQRDMMSFSEVVEKTSRVLETIVVEFEKVNSPEEIKSILEKDILYKINRIRKIDGEIVANEIAYFPEELGMNIHKESLKGSLFKVLEKQNIIVDHAESSIYSILMDDELKTIFNVNKEVPLLKTINKVFDSSAQVLFVEEAIYRSDKYILEVNISRREGKIK